MYTQPQVVSTGELATADIQNTQIVASIVALYAGEMSVASQAVGDLLYASSTTQWARIADVATGQVLVSGGVGVAPAWSANPTISGTLTVSGTAYIGDTANTNCTLGLTINQGAADNECLALKSSDIAHGITTLAETDTYAQCLKYGNTDGGLSVLGYTLGSVGLAIRSRAVNSNSTRSTSGVGGVMVIAELKSGTTVTTLGGDQNLFAVANSGTTRFILDSDGDSHQDVGTSWTQFDTHDDAEVLEALAIHVGRQDDPVARTFGEFLTTNKRKLTELELVTFNEDGHHFVNMSRLTMLLVGAARQSAARISRLERMALIPPGIPCLEA